jgi:hypothetical protein
MARRSRRNIFVAVVVFGIFVFSMATLTPQLAHSLAPPHTHQPPASSKATATAVPLRTPVPSHRDAEVPTVGPAVTDDLAAGDQAVAAGAGDEGDGSMLTCVSWRQTDHCDPAGARLNGSDIPCKAEVPAGASGFCECLDPAEPEGLPFRLAKSTCDHAPFRCKDVCTANDPDANNDEAADAAFDRDVASAADTVDREARARPSGVGLCLNFNDIDMGCPPLPDEQKWKVTGDRCNHTIPPGVSGECLCSPDAKEAMVIVPCEHRPISCEDLCAIGDLPLEDGQGGGERMKRRGDDRAGVLDVGDAKVGGNDAEPGGNDADPGREDEEQERIQRKQEMLDMQQQQEHAN